MTLPMRPDSEAERVPQPIRSAPPQYCARDMTQGGALALIRLDDRIYTLRITRAGKLILTK